MPEQEHSPEPWSYRYKEDDDDNAILRVDGEPIIYGIGMEYGALVASEEDIRRIVACVNACRGIPTEELEDEAKCKAADGDKAVYADGHGEVSLVASEDGLRRIVACVSAIHTMTLAVDLEGRVLADELTPPERGTSLLGP